MGQGPGYKILAAVKEELSDLNIIAEDLILWPGWSYWASLNTGFPGMKVLVAFNPDDDIDGLAAQTLWCTLEHDNNTVLGSLPQ